jgi:hypothetical protein
MTLEDVTEREEDRQKSQKQDKPNRRQQDSKRNWDHVQEDGTEERQIKKRRPMADDVKLNQVPGQKELSKMRQQKQEKPSVLMIQASPGPRKHQQTCLSHRFSQLAPKTRDC